MRTVPPSVQAVLDLIDFGIVLFDREGNALVVNSAAHDALTSGTFLKLVGNRLKASDSDARSAFATAIAKTCSLRMPTPLVVEELALDDAKRNVSILVTFVALPQRHEGAASEPDDLRGVLVFRIGSNVPAVRRKALLELFRFTPAELDLAQALLAGLTLDQCSARLKRSKNTLRTRLKAMMTKVGVHRQGDLVMLILRTQPQVRLA